MLELALGSDAQGDLFDPALQGSHRRVAGRPLVPELGRQPDPPRVPQPTRWAWLVETRALGWNFPQGNEDIIYFIYTFYNITSTNEADYAAVRPVAAADPAGAGRRRSRRANAARFGINLPAGGYTINDLFAAFVADMDVAQADANYAA